MLDERAKALLQAGLMALDEPLGPAEIHRQFDETGCVEGVIRIDLGEIVEICCQAGFEGLLDVLSCRLTGSSSLMEIDYEIVGVEDGTLLLKVDGDPSMIVEEDDDEGCSGVACSGCGEVFPEDDLESTYCGSFCAACLPAHLEACEVCAAEW